MVACGVGAEVHEVVGHDVEEVEGGVDVRDGGGGEGEHVLREAGHGGGEDFGGAEGEAEGVEEEGVGGDLPGFGGVGVEFVVGAVAAGVGLVRGVLFVGFGRRGRG